MLHVQPHQPPRAKKGAACRDCARRKRKCVHLVPPTTRKPIGEVDLSQQVQHVPACGETRLCLRFVETLTNLRLDHTWLAMLPCRVGQSTAVDAAIKAVVENKDLALHAHAPDAKGSLVDYVKSIEAVRTAMDTSEENLSDHILVSVALLCVCEALMQSEMFACFAHWGAMSTILLSRPLSWQPSELSRAILFHIRNQTFHLPCARGLPSPFDDPRWYSLEPAGRSSLPPEIARLKRLSNELLIRLPRLIALVRSLRQKFDQNTANQATTIALSLETLVNESAETAILHRIKVVKTTSPTDAEFTPFSFEYAHLGDLETAVVYWKFHLIFGKLQLRLLDLIPFLPFTKSKNQIREDMHRWGVNTMMSHQYALARQQYAHSKGVVAMPTAWIAMWALWEDREEDRGIPIQRWKEWNLDKLNDAIAVWQFQVTVEDLEVASELFAGGPLKGMFVAAYDQVPVWTTKVPSRIR